LERKGALEELAAVQAAAENEMAFEQRAAVAEYLENFVLCHGMSFKFQVPSFKPTFNAETQRPQSFAEKKLLNPLRFSAYSASLRLNSFGFLLASEFRILNSGGVPKWIKFIIAILLLPVCAGAARALWLVLCASGGADVVWVPLLAGAACWVVIFLLLPKPMWIYVFGHELTHALWAWLFGGQVKKLKVSSAGGHVVVSKSNFLIVLAPYFFPLYTALVFAVFAIGHLFWDWWNYLVWFHLLVGATYAFHVTLTWHVLKTRQSDITSQGWLFSAVILFLGNAGVLLLGLPFLTAKVGVLNALGWWLESTGQICHWLARMV
jgi:hypothetical protein